MHKDFTPSDVMKLVRDKEIVFVDLRFMDFPGMQQHFTVPAAELKESIFEDGLGFDGSSIRGWQAINESDMLVMPDPRTATVDPFSEIPTLILYCNILDPITKERYSRDPRNIAQKAENYLLATGIADTCYVGPEAEFFVFDDVRYSVTSDHSYFFIDSDEAIWNSGRDEMPNLAYKLRHKEGYFPIPPSDQLHNLRQEMVKVMLECGLTVECHHHEVATAGQCEIDLRFSPLTNMADQLTLYKYIIKNVARRHNKTVTFMPKPMFGDNGSGMHCHLSLWKNGQPLMAGNKYAGLSQEALWFIG
ncbi:MAG TPA: glutamine synthetase beta-grasp domain-containing protein, partial [Candidatus Hydrogenedentes bacterium]|nr:glutamine synthetase beta-grasp domain-containing protein [Candidatus Hydrogenedentota bacterium]